MRGTTKWDPRRDPWVIDDDAFPEGGTFAQQAELLLRGAVLAPSGHNTQPWRFTLSEPSVIVSADPARRLPVADPDDRELTMSLGAAVIDQGSHRHAAPPSAAVPRRLSAGEVQVRPSARRRVSAVIDDGPRDVRADDEPADE